MSAAKFSPETIRARELAEQHDRAPIAHGLLSVVVGLRNLSIECKDSESEAKLDATAVALEAILSNRYEVTIGAAVETLAGLQAIAVELDQPRNRMTSCEDCGKRLAAIQFDRWDDHLCAPCRRVRKGIPAEARA